MRNRYIEWGFLALLVWHLLSFLIWRQDFWGAGAWIALSWPWSDSVAATSLLALGLVLTLSLVMSVYRSSPWVLVPGLFLWALLLSLHENTWWILNAGETLLVMLLPLWLLDRCQSKEGSTHPVSAFVVSLTLAIIFFEAAYSKGVYDVWWSGQKIQHILSVGSEVRGFVDRILQVRGFTDGLAWRLLGPTLILTEFSLAIGALFLTFGGKRLPTIRKAIVALGISFHLVTFVIMDLGPLPLIFVLAWLWGYRAEPPKISDFKNRNAVSWALALIFLASVALPMARRQFGLPIPDSIQSFSKNLRLNRSWQLFSDNRIRGKSRLVDIEANGQSLWTGARSLLATGASDLNLYDFYPGREVFIFSQNLRSRYVSEGKKLRAGGVSLRERNPVPEVCPNAVRRVLETKNDPPPGQIVELNFIIVSQNLERTSTPELEEIWKFRCGI